MADVNKKKNLTEGALALPGTNQYYTRTTANPTNSSQANAALGETTKNAPGQYKASDTVQNAYNQLQSVNSSKPADYQSNYSSQISSLLDNILTQKDFSYDFNQDALYQNYKDQYTQAGKQAMLDTQAAASNLSGGYGNSYAASAGAQAYQQYLTQLNNKMPELYNMALEKYQMDTNKMYDQLGAVSSQEDREYGQYRDDVSDWQTDRSYAANQYYNMYNQDYSAYRDQVSDYYTDRDYYSNRADNLWNQEFSQEQFDYQKERDAISDSQWQQAFDYQKSRDQVSDNQWAQSFNYNQNRDNISDNQWQQSFDYNKSRDEVSDNQWKQSFDYQKSRDAVSDAQWEKQYALSKASKSSSSGYTDGKKLTNAIQEQMEYLEGDELDDYMGQLLEAGYSYEALNDYLVQIGKSLDEEESEQVASPELMEEMYRNYRSKMNNGIWR